MEESVSNEQLLQDIKNTEQEIVAYQQLVSGFRTLASLPETPQVEARKYNFHAEAYSHAWGECAKLLRELHELKAGRGL